MLFSTSAMFFCLFCTQLTPTHSSSFRVQITSSKVTFCLNLIVLPAWFSLIMAFSLLTALFKNFDYICTFPFVYSVLISHTEVRAPQRWSGDSVCPVTQAAPSILFHTCMSSGNVSQMKDPVIWWQMEQKLLSMWSAVSPTSSNIWKPSLLSHKTTQKNEFGNFSKLSL